MEIASCSSSICALAYGHIRGMVGMRSSRAGLRTSGFRPRFGGLIEIEVLGSRIALEKPRSHERRPGCLFYINVQTKGQDLQTDDADNRNIAILLEVEGVLADVNRSGSRDAFNAAFQKLGLDCANWTSPVYMDLVRKTGGDEERMLVLFFERIGWPTSLPTDEKQSFLKNVLQEKHHAMEDYAVTDNILLRPGIEKFIDDAVDAGIPVIILSAYSRHGEEVSRHIVEKLGSERSHKVKIVGQEEVGKSFYGQFVLGKGVSAGIDELLANEAAKAVAAEKQRVAEEVASILKLSVEVDTTSDETLKKVIAALRAAAEYAGIPVQNCILLSGKQTGVCAAERIGMPCIVIRSSSTSRAEFPSAKAVMDGFGAGELTVSRVCRMAGS